MKNMKAVSITVGILVMTTAANAQFLAKHVSPDYNSIALECMVTRVTPPDHDRDPGYKVNLSAELHDDKVSSFDAVHTTVSGKEYRRSDQYPNATLTEGRDRIQWSGWWRYGNKQMIGTLYFNGRWRYDEQAKRNGRVETTINTVCHEDKNGL
jgi:hypothetical protein